MLLTNCFANSISINTLVRVLAKVSTKPIITIVVVIVIVRGVLLFVVMAMLILIEVEICSISSTRMLKGVSTNSVESGSGHSYSATSSYETHSTNK